MTMLEKVLTGSFTFKTVAPCDLASCTKRLMHRASSFHGFLTGKNRYVTYFENHGNTATISSKAVARGCFGY